MSLIKNSLAMLGSRMKDKITGFAGVVTSITFDAYGCVQALVTPPYDKEKDKIPESYWVDVKRLVQDGKRAMDAPDFDRIEFGREQGGNNLPLPRTAPVPR